MKSTIKNTKGYSRSKIINILFDLFGGKIEDDVIEDGLVKVGLMSKLERLTLKEMYIDQQLSAREISEQCGVSLGHVQKMITKYGFQKKKHGITTGNNEAHRRMLWKRKQQENQPHRKEVAVFHVDSDVPLFFCPSIEATARKLKIGREHIRNCLNPLNIRKTAYGFKFMLKSEYEKMMEKMNVIEEKTKKTIVIPKVELSCSSSLEDIVRAAKAS